MLLVIYLFIKKVILSANIAFVLTVMYAIYDEKRQLSVSGRTGSITDVLIDSCGALLAIIVLSIILTTEKGIVTILNKHKPNT